MGSRGLLIVVRFVGGLPQLLQLRDYLPCDAPAFLRRRVRLPVAYTVFLVHTMPIRHQTQFMEHVRGDAETTGGTAFIQ